MFKPSVRIRLVLSSLMISLITILGVGLITLFLVDAYFEQQEEGYLAQRAEEVVPVLNQALRFNRSDDFRLIVAMTGFISDVRIEVFDTSDRIVADSGPRTAMRLFDGGPSDEIQLAFGIVVGSDGTIQSISPPLAGDFLGERGQNLPIVIDPPLEFDVSTPLTAISDETLLVPLRYQDTTIGFMRLSEGPAVGEAVVESIRISLFIGSLVSLIVAIGVGLISARGVNSALNQLGTTAELMGSGDYSVRVPENRLLEFDKLASQFNTMANRLNGTIEALEAEREILRRFVADASHELRTPLTALKTFNSLIADESDISVQARFISESQKQIDHLDRLTSNLLDLSRLESGIRMVSIDSQDLGKTIWDTVGMVSGQAAAKRQTLTTQIPDRLVHFDHDQVLMQQAIQNILTNGIKYTPQGGEISLRLLETSAEIICEISDNGPGVSPDHLHRIFDRFYREPTAKGDGSGIGLAIVREIVGLHGGQIIAESDGQSGLTIRIAFPKLADSQGVH